jgi:hypothetical protein
MTLNKSTASEKNSKIHSIKSEIKSLFQFHFNSVIINTVAYSYKANN